MVNINLTDEERKKLVDETNEMIYELNILNMDIIALKEQLNKIGFFNKITSQDDKSLYNLMERRIILKSRRLIVLMDKIETNKELLGISNTRKKKKNKTL